MTEPGDTRRYAIDPELRDLVDLLPSTGPVDVEVARLQMEEALPLINADLDTSGLDIDDLRLGANGRDDVTVRIYTPTEQSGSGLLYIHGGGFTVGSIESEHSRAAALARDVGAVVVSVDYRLAPEHPFPAGLDDCYVALSWFHDQAPGLGVEQSRIGVIGHSAGGGLAAGLALMARDRGGPALCFQYLGIPELDDRLSTPSMRSFVDTPLFNLPAAVASWDHYLGADRVDVSPYASPARALDLTGLPPAYISTMEFDPLRDEGVLYALALLRAGVSCELHSFPGSFHGSAIVSSAEVSRRESAEAVAVLRRRLS